ncbi:hypothetical protein BFJ66_g3531 [Fusarium oxysporum f. sp. cepae]|uniref:F-box domain-containing protein n=1 Tax=Fusarium oxysporum f. sp. cepae TaxID=396571 RepID=A0A3L6N7M7_FUSOX|nr:hypothetical protein BFJ65_g12513 [Fusarium oxysporum f. sp. cepae]RKK52325.1 hypothetical protein BFJ67_g5654 [Fusarium oxysporum f. sp. cepae]RKK56624.1 hypothetical protein BFJ66_g3531 [Fusarium oxysporum f. sp. cepae]
MEEIDPYCCLCGIYIALTPSNRSRSLWLDRFYVVYTFDREANARAYLSTDGFRASRHHYIVVDPADYRFNDGRSIRVILMPYDCENPFRGPLPPGMPPEAWGYPFHAACWKILNTFGTVDQKDLQSILNLCHSAPKQLGMLNWGHDYRGQACHRLHVAPGEENFLTWSYRRDPNANPYSIVELTQIFDKLASNTFNNFTESEPLPKLHRFTVCDPFLRLPADILLELANHLTLSEVTLMKRSSRAFTNLVLPSRFWKNRFRLGREFDCIFEAKKHTGGNWESIYRATNALKSDRKTRNALQLRRHVWDFSSPMYKLLQSMRQTTCDGHRVQSMFEPDAMPAELLDQKSWTNVSRTLSPPGKLFQRGCRFFYTRMLVLPSNPSAVYVSTIDIFERRYVSGLRFSDGNSKDFTIGFQHPRQEELLAQQATSIQIKGFDVAFDQHGVRGICILFGDGTQSYWAGEYENIPKRRVQGYAEEDTVTHLMGGFDAAKLVIIAINRDPASWEPTMSTLWYPEIPTPDLLFPGLDATINNPFRPSSSVEQDLPACFALFPNGDPSKLRRIIVKHRVHSKDVLKIEYVNMASIDKSQSELGYRRAGGRYSTEYDTNRIYVQSFLIDGPGGERIESFSTLWTHALVGFEIKTNRGRTAAFTGGTGIENKAPMSSLA